MPPPRWPLLCIRLKCPFLPSRSASGECKTPQAPHFPPSEVDCLLPAPSLIQFFFQHFLSPHSLVVGSEGLHSFSFFNFAERPSFLIKTNPRPSCRVGAPNTGRNTQTFQEVLCKGCNGVFLDGPERGFEANKTGTTGFPFFSTETYC